MLDVDELLELFGVGLEVLESVRLSFEHRERHVEIVPEIALIALARKLIGTVTKHYGLVSLGGAAIVLALAGAYTRLRPE